MIIYVVVFLKLDNVPAQLLVELSDVIIDCVRKGKASNGRYYKHVMILTMIILYRSLEFLPKILSLVAMATTVTVRGNYKYILKYYEVHNYM